MANADTAVARVILLPQQHVRAVLADVSISNRRFDRRRLQLGLIHRHCCIHASHVLTTSTSVAVTVHVLPVWSTTGCSRSGRGAAMQPAALCWALA